MCKQMQDPPKSKVRFRLSDVDDNEEIIYESDTIEDNEEIIDESDTPDDNENIQSQSILDAVEAAASNKMHPLLQMQTDLPLFEGLPGYTQSSRSDNVDLPEQSPIIKQQLRIKPVLSDDLNHQKALAEIAAKAALEAATKKKNDAVKFKTPTGDPPPVDALLSLTYNQREELLQKMYIKAKNNVMATADKNADKDTINEAIRREMDRLVDLYKSTH
jgi:hypothetical protein